VTKKADVDAAEVLFEFVRLGNAVKVTAFHVPSLTEISIVGPRGAHQEHLKLLAVKRLQYVLAKNRGAEEA
jgi:hypothetical protein